MVVGNLDKLPVRSTGGLQEDKQALNATVKLRSCVLGLSSAMGIFEWGRVSVQQKNNPHEQYLGWKE
jgi:hypothetical protein